MYADFYIVVFQFFLADKGYHWTDYARCLEPHVYECIIPQEEMDFLNYTIDMANRDEPCYENRFLPKEPINQDSCPELPKG